MGRATGRRSWARVRARLTLPGRVFQHLAEHTDTPQLASGFEATISKFDKNFSAHLLDLLARLSVYSTSDCEHGMASVISRWAQAAGRPHTRPERRGPGLPIGPPPCCPLPPSPLPSGHHRRGGQVCSGLRASVRGPHTLLLGTRHSLQ